MKQLKLLTALAATALAMTAIAATTATADVTVGNPNSGFALEGRMDADFPSEIGEQITCNVDLTLDVGGTGAIDVTNVDAYGDYYGDYACQVGNYPQERWFEDCYDAGWTGQIIGPGDDWEVFGQQVEYAGLGDFEAVIGACTELHELLVFRFAIDTDYEGTGAETWSLPSQPLGPPNWTINGTEWDDPANDLGLYIESVQ